MSNWSYKSYWFYVVVLAAVVVFALPAHAAVTSCGLSQDNPATPENDTRPCTGLVPCTGVTCSFCDLFKMLGNIFDFVVKTITPIVATGFIIFGGFKFITAGGDPTAISAARKILFNTLIGVVIVYASFVLASGLVAALAGRTGGTNFGFNRASFTFVCSGKDPKDVTGGGLSLTLKDMTAAVIDEGVVMTLPTGQDDPEGIVTPIKVEFDSGGNMVLRKGVNMSGVNSAALTGLQQAGLSLANDGIVLSVTSAKRDYTKQITLARQNCCPSDNQRCPLTSSSCRPPTCIPTDDQASNCPHVNGRAVDAWGVKDKQQCGGSSSCQQKVIQAMKAQGFCVLASEPWHFEKPAASGGKVSAGCRY